tara:strand:+ start:1682 stop:2692 length:1011 start_codon:yes stop_codon:yes gene_type:complete
LTRALITGGGGFLGSSIARLLLQEGWQVSVVGRSAYPNLEKLDINCYRIDLSRADQLHQQIEPVDVVFHVAAKAGIWGSYESYFEANVMATRHIINYCKNANIPMIYTSSPSVIFNGRNMANADESAPYPNHYHSYYPKTKAMAEREVLQAARNGQIKACSLRPHLIWGPGDNHLIPRFLQRGKAGTIAVVGDGKNLVDTVFVEDAATAHLQAAIELMKDDEISGEAFFISQDEPIALFDWINRILQQASIPPISKKIPANLAYLVGGTMECAYRILGLKSEPRMTRFLALELSTEHTFNLSKARKMLDYKPKHTMEQAFDKTFKSEYFRKLVQEL